MRRFRLLLIEDNKERIETFQSWLPEDTILVVATSGGQAMGVLKRVEPGDYAGLMLDHDLREQLKIVDEFALSGSDMVDLIIKRLDRDVGILIHSQNPGGASSMLKKLNQAGFWVIRVPMHQLTQETFREWVQDLREMWLEQAEC